MQLRFFSYVLFNYASATAFLQLPNMRFKLHPMYWSNASANDVFSGSYSSSQRHWLLSSKGAVLDKEFDQDFMDSMNEVCTKVIKTCNACDEGNAGELKLELLDLIRFLEDERDAGTVYFLRQLLRILDHQMPDGVDELVGPYKQAWNRIASALTGTLWRVGDEENKKEKSNKVPNAGESVLSSNMKKKDGLYVTLNLTRDATPAEIKASFRSLAMKFHPDVNDAKDAHDKFIELSAAYDTLSDPDLRVRYDMFGEIGSRPVGNGSNSDQVWDDLAEWVQENRKPKKAGKRQRARDQVLNIDRDAEWKGWDGVPENLRKNVAQFGDVVMYPLSQAVKDDLEDGREFGLGVVVGRNIDRGDVSKIPESLLELCEVEPLELIDGRWRADTISASAYPKLTQLEIVEVLSHQKGQVGENGGWYTLTHDLSEYSPQCYYEEIIL